MFIFTDNNFTEGVVYTPRVDAFLRIPKAPIKNDIINYFQIQFFQNLDNFRSIMAWSPGVRYVSSSHQIAQLKECNHNVRIEESGIFFPASVGIPSTRINLTKFVPVHSAIRRSERNYYDYSYGTITGFYRCEGLYYPFTTAHNSSVMPIRAKNFSSKVYYPSTPYRDDDLDFHEY